MKSLSTVLFATIIASTMAVSSGCKKDKKAAEKKEPVATAPTTTTPTPAATPTQVAPSPMAPDVALTGSAAENMVAVFSAGVAAIKTAKPAAAAAILKLTMTKYNIADLIAKSAADKEAGNGASDDLKQKFSAAKDAYKARAAELGKEDAAAFGSAAADWAKAWGLN